MKMCQPHWDKLRKAISDRGMDHLIAKSGELAARTIVKELEGNATPLDYDPLMDCNNMIFAHALKCGGLAMLCGEPERCPICEAVSHGADESWWINGPADAALGYAKENKLV